MTPCYKRNKFKHKTKQQAKNHARRVFDTDNTVLEVYLCVECQYWHIGHAMNPMKQRELERQYRG